MTTGGLAYFTSTYVNLRVIRELHRSSIPIEVAKTNLIKNMFEVCMQVFYAGADELTPSLIAFMEKSFDNVRFIDITQLPLLRGIDMKVCHHFITSSMFIIISLFLIIRAVSYGLRVD